MFLSIKNMMLFLRDGLKQINTNLRQSDIGTS